VILTPNDSPAALPVIVEPATPLRLPRLTAVLTPVSVTSAVAALSDSVAAELLQFAPT